MSEAQHTTMAHDEGQRESTGALTTRSGVSDRQRWLAVQLFVLAICVVAFVRAAWVSDDAFIAFRAMDNFIHGFGLVSNPGERVQGFTNPLWVLLLAPISKLTGEIYFTSISVSLLLSTATAALLVLVVARRPVDGLCAGLMLAFSRGFTDFATSGLENPLAHLLLVLLLLEYLREDTTPRGAFRISLLAALLTLTRMDLALLAAPMLVHFAIRTRGRKLLRYVAYGSLPFVAWEVFSVVYYGFPFPNTAYAKLKLAIPTGTLLMQGLGYLEDSLARDPLTLVVILFVIASAVAFRKARAIVPMLGVVLYLVYIVQVGGDFMSGRFLTACYALSVGVLASSILPELSVWGTGLVLGGTLLVVLSAPYNPLKPVFRRCVVPRDGITDERTCYYKNTGLLMNIHHGIDGWGYQRHPYWKAGLKKRAGKKKVYIGTLIGLGGYSAGPRIHIVDRAALTDPLLARIPFVPHGRWRIGHFYRPVPAGYLQTLESGKNQIKNPCIHRYYDMLGRVVSGPVFSLARFKAILALNSGRYEYLLSPGCRLPPG